MSSTPDYNLNDQIYENSDKTIKIYKTRKRATIRYIAVKSYNKRHHANKYNHEYNLIQPINHPNIVNIFSFSEDSNHFYMEMEYCPTGDLSRCFWENKKNGYNERTIKMISSQLLLGLQALHKNGIIHCNLKPSNILIDEYGNMRLCDFKKSLKTSTMRPEQIKKNKSAMTPCYTAPELFQEDGMYSFKTDFWALGCIMFELAVGQVPFFDESIERLISQIINEEVNFNRKELDSYSYEFVEVLKKLLEKDPNSRATWGEIEKCPFWEGFLNDNAPPSQGSSRNSSSTGRTKQTGIDPLRISRVVRRNLEEKNQDYNNMRQKNEVANPDQEFDFEDKETDMGSNSKQSINKLFTSSQFPLGVSVLNISKVFKRDQRQYHTTADDLARSSDEDMPKVQNFIINQTDRIIKPIIGNKQIEELPIVTYNKSKLPFSPWKIDMLKDMMNSPKDIKSVENYLYNIYSMLDSYANKKDIDNLINLLQYFETIVFDRELANNLINTSFISQFISFLKKVNNDIVKIRCCSIIGYLIRYATIIETPLDEHDFCEIICNVITKSTNQDLLKTATATVGEYLFYVATQEETPENKDWHIQNKYLTTLLFCLELQQNDQTKFYAVKTIENIAILTEVSKGYFASNDSFILKVIDIYKTTKNNDLKQSAINLCAHLIKHNTTLLKVFLNQIPIFKDTTIFTNENATIQQSLLNCLLFFCVKNTTGLELILPQCGNLIEGLVNDLEKFNNVLKHKSIILLGFLVSSKLNLIAKVGEDVFAKIQKFRKAKSNETVTAVRFFERMFDCTFIGDYFTTMLNKNDNVNEILESAKAINIVGSYQKIAITLFKVDFINNILSYLMNPKINNEALISEMCDILLKFSENPFSVEKNIDFILKTFLKNIISLITKLQSEEDKVTSISICANILSLILESEKLYTPNINNNNKINDNKTNMIMDTVLSLLPSLFALLKQNDLTSSILSLLTLIVERDDQYISAYIKEGIINYIFTIMTTPSYSNNLNVIKILILLTESNEIGITQISKMKLVDKINFFVENAESDPENDSIYMNYAIELFYTLMNKFNEIKKQKYTHNFDKEQYKSSFLSVIENVAKNFKLCIQLIGNEKNVNIQEKACMSLIYLLQLFPELYTPKFPMKFTIDDIPNLIKGLELSCYTIHKKMIKIINFILHFQTDGESIIKPYVTYIITYLENICNTSAEPSVIQLAQKLMKEDLAKLKRIK